MTTLPAGAWGFVMFAMRNRTQHQQSVFDPCSIRGWILLPDEPEIYELELYELELYE